MVEEGAYFRREYSKNFIFSLTVMKVEKEREYFINKFCELGEYRINTIGNYCLI